MELWQCFPNQRKESVTQIYMYIKRNRYKGAQLQKGSMLSNSVCQLTKFLPSESHWLSVGQEQLALEK